MGNAKSDTDEADAAKKGKPCIVGLGEVLWDCFPTGDRLGGAPLNFAAHCQQLGGAHGIRVAMFSRVGNDMLGLQAIEQIERLGVDTSNLQVDPNHRTGIVRVELDRGEPRYDIVSDVAWDYLQWNDKVAELASQASVVCFGSLAQRSPASREAIQQFVRQTPAMIRLFDINLRPPYVNTRIVMDSISLANVLKLNEEELNWLADELGVPVRDEVEVTALAVRHELSMETLLVTRGPLGCYHVSKEGVVSAEVPKLTYASDADAVGAGDSATAAFVIGLLRGRPLAAIMAHANRVGAYVASQPGAVPLLPAELIE